MGSGVLGKGSASNKVCAVFLAFVLAFGLNPIAAWAQPAQGDEGQQAPGQALATESDDMVAADDGYTIEVNANNLATIAISGAEVESYTVDGTTYNVVLKEGTADGTKVTATFTAAGDARLHPTADSALPQNPQQSIRIWNQQFNTTLPVIATLAEGKGSAAASSTASFSAAMAGTFVWHTVNFTVAQSTEPPAPATMTAYATLIRYGAFETGKDGTQLVNVPLQLEGEEATVDDVAGKLHELYYKDGLAGFNKPMNASDGSGQSVDAFWGEGLRYGYRSMVDGAMSSKTTKVNDGQAVLLYTNTSVSASHADTDYVTKFDKTRVEAAGGEAVTLNLQVGRPNGWGEAFAAFAGAPVTIDGAAANKATDASGNVTLYFPKAGTYVVSIADDNTADAKKYIQAYCTVTVTADDANAEATVASDKAKISVPEKTRTNLTLPVQGESGKTAIAWSSNNEAAIAADGKVTRATEDQQVELTATITYGDVTDKATYTVTVEGTQGMSELQRATEALSSAEPLAPQQWTSRDKKAKKLDTNIIEYAQAIVDKAAVGVKVAEVVLSSDYLVIGADGTITYDLDEETSATVTFTLSEGDQAEKVDVKVAVEQGVLSRQEVFDAYVAELPELILGNNPSLDKVTSNLSKTGNAVSLDTYVQATATVNSPYVSKYGSVTRPNYGESDAVVDISYRVTWYTLMETYMPSDYVGPNPSAKTVNVQVTILAFTEEEVAASKALVDETLAAFDPAAITYFVDKTKDVDLAAVMGDLSLPSVSGVTAKWTSADENVLKAPSYGTGRAVAVRDAIGGVDKSTTITLTLSKDGYSASRSFDVTVKPLTQEEIDADNAFMDQVEAGLTFDLIKKDNAARLKVTGDMQYYYRAIPDGNGGITWKSSNSSNDGVKISWTSSNTSVVTKYFKVTRPSGTADADVTLTFTLESVLYPDLVAKRTVVIPVRVLAKNTTVSLENEAPVLAEGVQPTAEVTVLPGEAYKLDLASLFADPDGNDLSYKVAVDGADAVAAEAAFETTYAEEGTHTLVFIANDGTLDSTATYTVTLTAKAEVPANLQLSKLEFRSGSSATSALRIMEPEFNPAKKEYTVIAPANMGTVGYAFATLADSAEGTIQAVYPHGTSGKEQVKTIKSGSYASLASSLASNTLTPNDITIKVDGQEAYIVHVVRQATLNTLTVKNDGAAVTLSPTFNGTKFEYDVNIPADAQLAVSPGISNTALGNAVTLDVAGQAVANKGTVTVAPTWSNRTYDLVITVGGEGARDTVYTIHCTEQPASLEVATPPTKTTYDPGETFDPAGMTLKATFADGGTQVVGADAYTFEPDGALKMADNTITVSYGGMTAEQPITINSPFEGKGTAEEPFLIKTAADYDTVKTIVASGDTLEGVYLKQVADITLSDGWTSIGTSPAKCFSANLDGDNHLLTVPKDCQPLIRFMKFGSVSNLNVYGERIDGAGLIDGFNITGVQLPTFVLDNITIKSGTNTVKSGILDITPPVNPFGVVSMSYAATIKNCTVEEGVTVGCDADRSYVGGIAGYMQGTLENCTSNATVKGVNYVGGIMGTVGNAMGAKTVKGCTFGGDVVASGDHVGGIVGGGFYNSTAPNAIRLNVLDNTVTGSVTGADKVGGIMGGSTFVAQAWNDYEFKNNTFMGKVSATDADATYVGGIIGYYRSLDKFDDIANNVYVRNGGAERGIGGVQYVDTSSETHETAIGELYFNTQSGTTDCPSVAGCRWKNAHNRTDDPLGADADALCKAFSVPELAEGVSATETERIPTGSTYSVDLSTIFVDGDGDALTYKVAIDGADPVATEAAFSYDVSAQGKVDGDTVTFVFTANDGTYECAEAYTVNLSVYSTDIVQARVSGLKVITIAAGEEAVQSTLVLRDGAYTLVEGKDYELSYENNTAAGVASVIIAGKGGYIGERTVKFKVKEAEPVVEPEAKSIMGVSVSGVTTVTIAKEGDAATLPALKLVDGDYVLVEGTDYSVAYKDNTAAGTATVTVTGMGAYEGTRDLLFAVKVAPQTQPGQAAGTAITKVTVKGLKVKYLSSGDTTQQLTLVYDGYTLVEGQDYTLSYANNDKVGVATITMTGAGDFTGSRLLKYKVKA